jgi:hypothetical protein
VIVYCIDCQKLELKNKPMASEGAGHCALDPSFCFVTFLMRRTCDKYVKADEATITARQEWAAKKFPIRLAQDEEEKVELAT